MTAEQLAALATDPAITGDVIATKLTAAALTAPGVWKLDVTIELSSGEFPGVRFEVTVLD